MQINTTTTYCTMRAVLNLEAKNSITASEEIAETMRRFERNKKITS